MFGGLPAVPKHPYGEEKAYTRNSYISLHLQTHYIANVLITNSLQGYASDKCYYVNQCL